MEIQAHSATPGARLDKIECAEIQECNLCGAPAENFRTFASIRGWHYTKCENCALVFLNPSPTPVGLSNYYNSAYRVEISAYQESVNRKKRWLLDLISQCGNPPGRLLEIGCSYGYFLAAARDEGWHVEGIELSDEAASLAERERGVRVIAGTLEEVSKTCTVPYDVIVAWHVIEHLTDPCRFLRDVFELLRPGGILALRTPNVSSMVARFAGVNWEWLSPPDHTHLFDPSSLRTALSNCGFQIVKSTTARGDGSNMFYEILRSWGRVLLLREPNPKSPVIPVSQPRRFASRGWYRVAKRSIEILSQPLDWALSPWLAGWGKAPEVVMLSRKPAWEETRAS